MDATGNTVRDLIEKLEQYPDDYLVSFQTGDTIGNEEILKLKSIEPDNIFGMVDVVFEETDEGL